MKKKKEEKSHCSTIFEVKSSKERLEYDRVLTYKEYKLVVDYLNKKWGK